MHHKRRKPKHQRSGCLYCKPHKDDRSGGIGDEKASVQRDIAGAEEKVVNWEKDVEL